LRRELEGKRRDRAEDHDSPSKLELTREKKRIRGVCATVYHPRPIAVKKEVAMEFLEKASAGDADQE
jgi:hypothetical protein